MKVDPNDPNIPPAYKSIIASGKTTLDEVLSRVMEIQDSGGGLIVGSNAIKELKSKVTELNELISLNRQFPNLRESLNARVSERFKFTEADSPTFVSTITSREEYDALPTGSVFMVQGDNGETTVGIKE